MNQHLEMCFITDQPNSLSQLVEDGLNGCFDKRAVWYLHNKREHELQIVTAEIHIQGEWESEESLMNYVDEHFHPELLDRLYGYHVTMESTPMGGCCGCGKAG